MKALLEDREQLLRQQIEAASARLIEVATAIERDGVTVIGSRGQLRSNPLLTAERELRRERTKALDQLEAVLWRLENERLVAEANAIMAWNRTTAAVSD
jgi:hypothetical protein